MTELDIIKFLSRKLDDKKYIFQVPNAFIYPGWECDYWVCDKDGQTKEFEVKISRGDYFKDLQKDKHKAQSGANFFYYVVPAGMIKPEEVDKKYGLVYVYDTYLSIVKRAGRLNKYRFSEWQMLATKMHYRYRQLWTLFYLDKDITYEEYQDGKVINDLNIQPKNG